MAANQEPRSPATTRMTATASKPAMRRSAVGAGHPHRAARPMDAAYRAATRGAIRIAVCAGTESARSAKSATPARSTVRRLGLCAGTGSVRPAAGRTACRVPPTAAARPAAHRRIVFAAVTATVRSPSRAATPCAPSRPGNAARRP